MVSVIVPFYNEEKSIGHCLSSLSQQIYKPLEIVAVNDGSTDGSLEKVRKLEQSIEYLKLLNQTHLGPASARNLGSQNAKGDILVFVDADMTFAKDFIAKLIKPIEQGDTIGTFSKDEFLANKDNIWALYWNINRYLINSWQLNTEASNRILPANYKSNQPVFRAILKKEFDRVGGFDNIGYTDDWTLSRKLGKKAEAAPGAVFYHKNPETLGEVFTQARWIGKNEFLTTGYPRKIYNLLRYCFINSLLLGLAVVVRIKKPLFLPFKIIYDFGVWSSVVGSFFNKSIIK